MKKCRYAGTFVLPEKSVSKDTISRLCTRRTGAFLVLKYNVSWHCTKQTDVLLVLEKVALETFPIAIIMGIAVVKIQNVDSFNLPPGGIMQINSGCHTRMLQILYF